MLIEYVGRSATKRVVRRVDFKENNIDHGEVVFDVADIMTRGQAAMSDEAAELLLRVEPNAFRKVEKGKEATAFRRDSEGAGK